MSSIETFRVGTSSPRRIVNTEKNLKHFLPNANANIEVKCEMLRGNVNTRIQKLHDGDMDAIVLAHAGLERLANQEDSAKILKDLLKGLDFMIMPQDYFPSSAAQGALAVEVSDNTSDEIKEALKLMDDQHTRDEVKRERVAFNSYGGGCHLAVGINVKKFNDFYIHTHKGSHNEEIISLNKLEGQDYTNLPGKTFFFPCKQAPYISKIINEQKVDSNSNLYITSKYCLDSLDNNHNYSSIWTAGSMTHKELVKKGFWVNGNANALGESEINNLYDSKVIKLIIGEEKWITLSHDKAQPAIGELFSSYSRELASELYLEVPLTDAIYWTSFFEYESLTTKYPQLLNKIHICGLGKTYSLFKENNIEVIPFINHSHAKSVLKEI
jgi:hydroxymethylbilane synthase